MSLHTSEQIKATKPAVALADRAVLQRNCAGGNPKSVTSLQRSVAGNPPTDQLGPAALSDLRTGPIGKQTPGHDFSQIPVHGKTPARLQTKLTVNAPGDVYEQEADLVADRVMRMETPAPPIHPKIREDQLVQRRTGSGDGLETIAPSVIDVVHSPGSPLDANTRAYMEPRFGRDFSQVRVHTGTAAEQSARDVNANAYTAGNHIVFDSGRFAPGSNAGYRLLAHELTHVAQQADPYSTGVVQRTPSGPEELAGAAKKWLSDKYASGKTTVYKGLISTLRTFQKTTFDGLRAQVYRIPTSAQSALVTILDVCEEIFGVLITLLLAVVGIVVGFAEGIVGMVEGLVSLVYGILKWFSYLILGFFDNGEKFNQYNKELITAAQNIPNGLRAFVNDWLERFEKAPIDEGSLMIAELTGQVIAIIASFGIAAAKVGQVPKLIGNFTVVASKGGELGLVAGTVAPQTAAAGAAAVALTAPTLIAGAQNNPANAGGKAPPRRPSWQQSEKYVEDYLGKDWERQKSYRDTEPAKRSDFGNVAPDVYNKKLNIAAEVKNYDLLKEYDSLVSVLKEQGGGRLAYMPNGVRQWLFLDIRGQNITDLAELAARIQKDTGGPRIFEHVHFITDTAVVQF